MAMLHPRAWKRASQGLRERSLRRWMVVIVRGSAAWRPQEWDDEPFDAEPVYTAKRGLRLSRARGFAFGFNTASMDTHARLWAIVQPDFGRTIDSVGLVSCQNYLRANGL
ncbi:MAG TPA: hypothetical protein VMV10_24235 [Pirellulales bacterium]|nr:hypothetical protein [Pirellulales bacterium]